MTDARLHSDRPIDDELPFDDAPPVDRGEPPQEIDAYVAPAAAQVKRSMPDPDVEPSGLRDEEAELAG